MQWRFGQLAFATSLSRGRKVAPGLSNRGTLEPRGVFNFYLQRSLQTIPTPSQMRDCRSKGKVLSPGDKFLYFSVSLPILLVAEALDRIEARRFARRPDAE